MQGYRQAYCDKNDAGEFARVLFNAVPRYAQLPLAKWIRKYGLNVTIDHSNVGKTLIGGVLNPKKSEQHISDSKNDVYILPIVDAHVMKKTVVKKEKTGTWSEQAQTAIESLITRTKKESPEVAAVINQRLNSNPLAELNLTIAEIAAVKEFIAAKRQVLPALKLAA